MCAYIYISKLIDYKIMRALCSSEKSVFNSWKYLAKSFQDRRKY